MKLTAGYGNVASKRRCVVGRRGSRPRDEENRRLLRHRAWGDL